MAQYLCANSTGNYFQIPLSLIQRASYFAGSSQYCETNAGGTLVRLTANDRPKFGAAAVDLSEASVRWPRDRANVVRDWRVAVRRQLNKKSQVVNDLRMFRRGDYHLGTPVARLYQSVRSSTLSARPCRRCPVAACHKTQSLKVLCTAAALTQVIA